MSAEIELCHENPNHVIISLCLVFFLGVEFMNQLHAEFHSSRSFSNQMTSEFFFHRNRENTFFQNINFDYVNENRKKLNKLIVTISKTLNEESLKFGVFQKKNDVIRNRSIQFEIGIFVRS